MGNVWCSDSVRGGVYARQASKQTVVDVSDDNRPNMWEADAPVMTTTTGGVSWSPGQTIEWRCPGCGKDGRGCACSPVVRSRAGLCVAEQRTKGHGYQAHVWHDGWQAICSGRTWDTAYEAITEARKRYPDAGALRAVHVHPGDDACPCGGEVERCERCGGVGYV